MNELDNEIENDKLIKEDNDLNIRRSLNQIKIFVKNSKMFNKLKCIIKDSNISNLQTLLLIIISLFLVKRLSNRNFSITFLMFYISMFYGAVQVYILYQEYLKWRHLKVVKCYKILIDNFEKQKKLLKHESIIFKKKNIQSFCKDNNLNDLDFISKELTKMILDDNRLEEKIMYMNNEYVTIIKYKI